MNAEELTEVVRNRKLLKLIWHVTNRCNFSCTYCYVMVNRFKTDLPTASMLKIADKINQSGVNSVTLTGGEVFTREDVLPILDRLSDRLRIGIATNGSRITPALARYLADRDIFVSITIDSLDSRVNEITRVGSHTPSLLKNVKLLIDSGVRTGISTVATQTSYKDLPRMADHFHRLGAHSWKVGVLRNAGEALESRSYGALFLDYEEEESVLRSLYELREKYRPAGFDVTASMSPHPTYFETFALERDRSGSCLCGYAKAVLKHDGGLVPCDTIKYPEDYNHSGFTIPNVLGDQTLDEVFQGSSLFRLWSLATAGVVPIGCSHCSYFDNCRGFCRGQSMVGHGAPAGLLGRSQNCARNNKLRATGGHAIRMVHPVKEEAPV